LQVIKDLIKGGVGYYEERDQNCILVLDKEFDETHLDTKIWPQLNYTMCVY
jgi:hypothetical protein